MKQALLGRAVSVHRAVIFEVIAGQIRKYRDVKLCPTHPLLIESDRRDLHGAAHGTRRTELREFPMQGNRIGRRIGTVLKVVRKAVAEGTDYGAFLAE